MSLNKNDLVQMFENASIGYKKSFVDSILKATGRGGVYAARDYIHANCVLATLVKYNADKNQLDKEEDIKKFIPKAVLFRLNSYTPCLAARYDELKKPAQEKIFNNQNWIATLKENGCRGWLIHAQGKWYLFSRNYSDVDCSLIDYWDNIYQFPTIPDDEIFAIDVEVKYEPNYDLQKQLEEFGMTTESKLEAMSALLQTRAETAKGIQQKYKEVSGKDLIAFRLIYPLYYKGKNYMKRKLGEGHAVYSEVVKYAQEHGINLQAIDRCKGTKEKKEVFVNSIIDAGGEGVVFHNLLANYCTSENRDKDCFVKLKRSVGGTSAKQGMGDTIDGWISGFKLGSDGTANEGLVSAFEISCYVVGNDGVPREHLIASVPNISKEMKQDCTTTDENGNPVLKEEYLGLVVECDGQAISRVSRRLTHPRMLRLRFDKSKEECIYNWSWIESQMDNFQ